MGDDATPWRALEAPSEPASTTDPPRRPNLALAGFGIATVLGILAFALAATGGSGSVTVADSDPGRSIQVPAGSGGASSSGGDVVVELAGAVRHPGVYRLGRGARVGDAIAAAGGYGPRLDAARASALNLAATVKDGDRIEVPSRDDRVATTAATGSAAGGGGGGLVDLNHATAGELDVLPGIGPATAAKIIAARDEQPFATIDDLGTRKVVGPSTLEKIRALVTVR